MKHRKQQYFHQFFENSELKTTHLTSKQKDGYQYPARKPTMLNTKLQSRWPKKIYKISTHCKTQAISLLSRQQLPQLQIMKNPLVQMKPNQIQRSSKIILNSAKNTKILNEIIDILRDDSQQPCPRRRSSSKPLIKRIETQPINNQFLLNNEADQKNIPIFRRGPKIVSTDLPKLVQKQKIIKRKIFSQERPRLVQKAKNSLNINIKNSENSQADANNLTFYRPSLKARISFSPSTLVLSTQIFNNLKSIDKQLNSHI